jgi:hypothetical protein
MGRLEREYKTLLDSFGKVTGELASAKATCNSQSSNLTFFQNKAEEAFARERAIH